MCIWSSPCSVSRTAVETPLKQSTENEAKMAEAVAHHTTLSVDLGGSRFMVRARTQRVATKMPGTA